MQYSKTVQIRDGGTCILRSATAQDAQAVLDVFIRTHEQTDYLLSYPDEVTFTVEQEADFLQKAADSDAGCEILAEVDGRIVGSAGFSRVGDQEKIRHRAEFGISVDRAYWRLGIGRALTEACIECAAQAGLAQLELEVVAENEHAIALYQSEGFTEYGRNPKGFLSRRTGWQPLVLMRLEL